MQNVRLALRTLFRTPFVTTVAILSLALGIGANVAIYSLFNLMLLQPLPVPHPERLVNFAAPGPQDGHNECSAAGDCDEVFSYPMFRDLQKANTAFSGIAGHYPFEVNVAMAGQTPVNGRGLMVSGSYFPVLGIRPALGRLLTPNDDQVIGGHYVAVLSNAFWADQLGSNAAVVGQQMTINGQQMTIVGVAQEGFSGTTIGERPDVFVPISMRAAMDQGWKGVEARNAYWVYLFGRLKANASIDEARASVNPVYHRIINDVEAPLHPKLSAPTMRRFRAKEITLADGRRGQSETIKESRMPLVLLFSITGIVLLIACANIANLLLARAANRAMEMAVRLSLGAARKQLIGQLLTESVLLAVLGGAVSVVVAHWTLDGISALLPPQAVQGLDLGLSVPVLVFTAVVSLGTGLLFGIVPALQSTRPDLVTELRNNSGKLAGSRGAARFRSSLVTAQIALSMALLIGAGLFIKSLRNISRVNLGIKIDNVVQFGISPGRSGYDSTRARALYARVERTLASLPGVSAVTSASVAVLIHNWGSRVSVEGFKKDPDTDDNSRRNFVGPNYFHLLGVPILAGRDITEGDNAGATRVAVVNEAFAEKFHLGANPVGKRMSVNNDSLNIVIVGLVKNSSYYQVKGGMPPVYVLPWRQASPQASLTFYMRSTAPPERILRAIPRAMKTLDPSLPVEDLETLPQVVRESVYLDRMISILSAAFAALATLLAAVGLYGVLAYSVAQRTREIGVRMALGANAGAVQWLVLGQVAAMTAIGGVIGIAGALALGRGARSLLFELQGYDPTVIAIASVALVLVAFGAGFVPAVRASRVDPMAALRYE